jgi:uncharacterized membrane protein
MVVIKAILLMIVLFVTLLWVTKLITDCVSAIYGNNFSDETAQRDGILRIYMIIIMSILWPIVIIMW